MICVSCLRIKNPLLSVRLLPGNAWQCRFVGDSAHFAAAWYRTLSDGTATSEETWSKHGDGPVPLTWHGASPALRARVARARDAELRPSDRLRYATTLPEPPQPVPRPAGQPDLAAVRAARLPDQGSAQPFCRLGD
jgi:hypothetical protein